MRVWVIAAICLVAACGQGGEQAKAPEAPPAVIAPAPLTQEETNSRRIADLLALNGAIQAYHAAHGSYPVSPGHGFSTEIPGLAPQFIQQIPPEPSGNTDPNGPQYRYASNGTDYKLIVHGVSGEATCGAFVERDGVRIDPMRTRDGQCWAYGFWTEGYREL